MAQAILRGNIDFKREPWPNVSDNAKDLVRHMLEPDPKLRLTAKQVLGMSSLMLKKQTLICHLPISLRILEIIKLISLSVPHKAFYNHFLPFLPTVKNCDHVQFDLAFLMYFHF